MSVISAVLLVAFFLFIAIATSVMSGSAVPALVILIPTVLAFTYLAVMTSDMGKAYIEIGEDSITVVDYFFFRKRERRIPRSDVQKGEIYIARSSRVKGYRYTSIGYTYIVFTSAEGKYLFKVINYPVTHDYFSKIFPIE